MGLVPVGPELRYAMILLLGLICRRRCQRKPRAPTPDACRRDCRSFYRLFASSPPPFSARLMRTNARHRPMTASKPPSPRFDQDHGARRHQQQGKRESSSTNRRPLLSPSSLPRPQKQSSPWGVRRPARVVPGQHGHDGGVRRALSQVVGGKRAQRARANRTNRASVTTTPAPNPNGAVLGGRGRPG